MLEPLILFLISAATLLPQEVTGPLVTDRPDATESASVVIPGFFQIESGALIAFEGETEAYDLGSTLIRIGVFNKIELRVGWSGLVGIQIDEVSDSGAGDAEVGAKFVLRNGSEGGVAFAVLGSVSLPIGSDGFSSDEFNPAFRFAVAKDLTKDLGVGGNLGVRWEGNDRYLIYTLSLARGLSDRLGAFAEIFGEVLLDRDREVHAVDGGLTFLLQDNVQIDVFGGAGLTDASSDWFVGGGVSIRLPN